MSVETFLNGRVVLHCGDSRDVMKTLADNSIDSFVTDPPYALLLADWTPLSELMAAMGWQAHTVSGALSTAAKARGITIERNRVEGVTSYRVAQG